MIQDGVDARANGYTGDEPMECVSRSLLRWESSY